MIKAVTVMIVALFLSACENYEYGRYQAILVLASTDGQIRHFDLGSGFSLAACADVAMLEIRAAKDDRRGLFWSNPSFTYGGNKGTDDWMAFRITGFQCVLDQQPT
jgi:hypothetical protein